MNKRIALLAILLSLIEIIAVSGQTVTGARFTHLGIENGLSNNYVTDIAQDGQGRIWVATERGLNLFDGYNFTIFNSYNSPLKHDAINTVYYDSGTNRLWAGCKYGGLYSIDCSTFRIEYLSILGGHRLSNVSVLEKRHDGGFWVMPLNGGIFWYDEKTHDFKKLEVKGLNDKERLACAVDGGEGILYIGTEKRGMAEVNIKTRQATFHEYEGTGNSLLSNRVFCICQDHAENIWLGTGRGLALYDRSGRGFKMFYHEDGNPGSIISNHIYDVTETHDGHLHMGSDIGGISILNLRQALSDGLGTARFTNILPGNRRGELSSGYIRTIFQDSQGNIWIGNYGTGLDVQSHIQPPFITPRYMAEGSEKLKSVWGVCQDSQGNIWAGGENEIVMIDSDGSVAKTVSIKKAITNPYSQVFSMTSDGHDGLLLGIYDDGLLHYDIKNDILTRVNLRKSYTDVISFFNDTDGSVLIGTEDGLFRYSNGHAVRLDSYTNQLAEPFIYGICRDRQGKLWIANYSGGINVFNQDGRIKLRLDVNNGLPTNGMNSLFMDSRGHIWAATRAGLVEFSDTRNLRNIHVYGYKEGLTDLFVRAVAEDKARNIWLSTNNGISMWDTRKHKFYNYSLHDGLPAGNFIEGSALKTNGGAMVFGSLGGMCLFYPQTVLSRQLDVPVHIAMCKRIGGQAENQASEAIVPIKDGQIKLSYDENSLVLTFFVPDFALRDQVEYAVKVEGLDDEWTNTMGENRLTLRNISYGNYQIKVKARIRNQQWDDRNMASMDIVVTPPWWLSWPAKTAYIIVLISIGVLIMHRYVKRIKTESALDAERKRMENEQELNEERLRFYTNVTHELRTPLTLILGPLEDLVNDTSLPKSFQPRIKSIRYSAERLLTIINQLLDFRKTETHNRRLTVEHGDISTLITEIGLRYKELNQNKNVDISIYINTASSVLWFDREIITTILDNLMSNAMKYTPQGSISLLVNSITGTKGEPLTEITVKDTGYGISPDALPHIFERFYQADGKHQASGTGIGLAIVKSLAELHQAQLKVESIVGQGTTFKLTLNTENTYPEAARRKQDQPIPPTNVISSEPEKPANDEKKLMLIIEDNADIRQYIADSFSDEYKILTAANGKEGWEKAKASVPDIIISDIMMPVMDGLELCRMIKNNISTSHIPVILLTAKDSLTDKEMGYDTGADSYLVKPFSAKLLKSRVNNLLESRRKLAMLLADRSSKPQITTTDIEDNPIGQSLSGLNTMSTMFLKRFEEIVENNICNEKLDIQFLAAELCMSQSSLYRKVKALTGISGNELIRNIRLRHALQIMLNGTTNISTAAYQSGFNDLPYFRQCFKKEYGMSPKEYLETH